MGGSSVANHLRCRMGRKHDVLLLDKMGSHVFWLALFWIQVGLREPKAITKDIGRLLKRGIDVARGEVSCIDAATTCAKVDGKKIGTDYLVVPLGADLAPGNVPGFDEAGHNLYSPEGSISKMALRRPTIFLAYVLPHVVPEVVCKAGPAEGGGWKRWTASPWRPGSLGCLPSAITPRPFGDGPATAQDRRGCLPPSPGRGQPSRTGSTGRAAMGRLMGTGCASSRQGVAGPDLAEAIFTDTRWPRSNFTSPAESGTW